MSSGQNPGGGRADGAPGSPYYEWTRATGFAYYGQAAWLPLLIELQDTSELRGRAVDFAGYVLKMQREGTGPAWVGELCVPDFYTAVPPRMAGHISFVSVLARPAFVDAVSRGAAPAQSIRNFQLGRANLPPGVALQSHTPPAAISGPWCGARPTVITAVIDDGIAFAHDRFLGSDGTTRVEYFWDQQYPALFNLGIGIELSKSDPAKGIEALRLSSSHGGPVDEDELYRRSGQIDLQRPAAYQPLLARAAHGAHVMDLACNAPLPPVVPVPGVPVPQYVPHQPPPLGERPIIAVQLPSASVATTSDATLEPQIFNGVFYAIVRADDIAQRCGSPPLPLVVNASYGIFSGPHDGSSLFERALDHLLQLCNTNPDAPVRVTLPAGNQHLSRCHARFDVPAGATRSLDWRVSPDDQTESWVEIRLPVGTDASQVSVSLNAPHGVAGSGPAFGGMTKQVQVGGGPIGMVVHPPFPSPDGRSCVTVFLAPTASHDPGLALAPAGLWRIDVHNAKDGPLSDVDAWIRRDEAAPGYRRRGRQSFFEDPLYARFDGVGRAIEDDADPHTAASDVKREGTLNGLATGGEPLVAGGFRRSDRRVAPYSASGPVPRPAAPGLPAGVGPEALLPSDDAPSHRGVLAAGTRSGSCVALQGTSVATPLATRWAAGQMSQVPPGKSDRAALFYRAAAEDLPAGQRPAAQRGGGGRIAFSCNRLPR